MGQIEALAVIFQDFNNPQALCVVGEISRKYLFQHRLATVPKRCVAKIVPQGNPSTRSSFKNSARAMALAICATSSVWVKRVR